ncbi:MAG: type III pantothenate kinase [Candidatus Omnitrophica bacterium]|nr:type III pantothenate kinase [Candidatus Omnitrophota bacterium]
MLLAIDIGNTNITFGVFAKYRLIKNFKIPTNSYNLKKLRKNLDNLVIDDAIVCSVVPIITRVLEKDLRSLLKKSPYIIGKNLKVPIKNLYRRPSKVGSDRLVNAYACVELYGYPAICVDFGTAITFDVISAKAEYIGGIIVPGLELSLEALSKKAALLPKITLKAPESLIGRDTVNSMRSGAVYGISALTDGLIKKLRIELKKAIVIATGGNADLIARFCSSIDEVDKDLTLQGLNLIYYSLEKNLKKFKKSKK